MSPSGIASNRQAEARLRRARELAREQFLACATRYFRAATDEERESIRPHVIAAGSGLDAHEIQALTEAAKVAARGAGHHGSSLTTSTRLLGGS